jgi:YqaJ-like viral recombinase domain
MSLEILNHEQGSPEWFADRLGIPTGSEFKTVLRERGRTKGSESEERRKYIDRLAAEIYTGDHVAEWSGNEHTERGSAMEPAAREWYALVNDVQPQQVGFLRNGRKGVSPDSLILASGMLEIKTKLPSSLMALHRKGGVPPEHVAQCQGNLWIAEREWIDLLVYWPRMPKYVVRIYRDEAFIETLSKAVDAFNEEVDEAVAFLRYLDGGPSPLMAALKASAEAVA